MLSGRKLGCQIVPKKYKDKDSSSVGGAKVGATRQKSVESACTSHPTTVNGKSLDELLSVRDELLNKLLEEQRKEGISEKPATVRKPTRQKGNSKKHGNSETVMKPASKLANVTLGAELNRSIAKKPRPGVEEWEKAARQARVKEEEKRIESHCSKDVGQIDELLSPIKSAGTRDRGSSHPRDQRPKSRSNQGETKPSRDTAVKGKIEKQVAAPRRCRRLSDTSTSSEESSGHNSTGELSDKGEASDDEGAFRICEDAVDVKQSLTDIQDNGGMMDTHFARVGGECWSKIGARGLDPSLPLIEEEPEVEPWDQELPTAASTPNRAHSLTPPPLLSSALMTDHTNTTGQNFTSNLLRSSRATSSTLDQSSSSGTDGNSSFLSNTGIDEDALAIFGRSDDGSLSASNICSETDDNTVIALAPKGTSCPTKTDEKVRQNNSAKTCEPQTEEATNEEIEDEEEGIISDEGSEDGGEPSSSTHDKSCKSDESSKSLISDEASPASNLAASANPSSVAKPCQIASSETLSCQPQPSTSVQAESPGDAKQEPKTAIPKTQSMAIVQPVIKCEAREVPVDDEKSEGEIDDSDDDDDNTTVSAQVPQLTASCSVITIAQSTADHAVNRSVPAAVSSKQDKPPLSQSSGPSRSPSCRSVPASPQTSTRGRSDGRRSRTVNSVVKKQLPTKSGTSPTVPSVPSGGVRSSLKTAMPSVVSASKVPPKPSHTLKRCSVSSPALSAATPPPSKKAALLPASLATVLPVVAGASDSKAPVCDSVSVTGIDSPMRSRSPVRIIGASSINNQQWSSSSEESQSSSDDGDSNGDAESSDDDDLDASASPAMVEIGVEEDDDDTVAAEDVSTSTDKDKPIGVPIAIAKDIPTPVPAPQILELDPSVVEGLDDDEIDALLEKPLKDFETERSKFAGLKEPPIVKDKVVLKYRGTEYFEILPEGWIEITHASGIPVYLHKSTRVCTLSRPYFIGPGSARRHDVPLSSIPCLYQKQVQGWEKDRENRRNDATSNSQPDGEMTSAGGGSGTRCPVASTSAPGRCSNTNQKLPEVYVETLEDFKKRCLDSGQLHDYCKKSFEFQMLKVWRFKNWSDHRQFHKNQRARPTLPANVKLITVPSMGKGTRPQRKQFYLNPHGKTSVCLLHEYVQKVMHTSPEYELGQTTNASQPYSATVIIQETRYATGYGNNKKEAKRDSARKTLAVLIPDMDFDDDGAKVKLPNQADVLELFDLFSVTDTRVFELSTKAGQPAPYQILMECLKRNAAFGDTQLRTDIKHVRHQQHEFTMKVGKHEVKVLCGNKKDGKQKASQSMLELLHPHVKTWGSLLRLYGYGTGAPKGTNVIAVTGIKGGEAGAGGSKKNQRVGDGAAAAAYPPNKTILEKLRREMTKLYDHRKHGDGEEAKNRENSMVAQAIKNISF